METIGPEGFWVEFLVAGAVGGLIGVEREHRDDGAPVIAGIRTFPLISIAGFLTALLAVTTGSPLLLAAGLAGAFALAFAFIQMRAGLGQTGITTPVSMVVTYLLGVTIGYGYTFEAVAVGVVATFLLVAKKRLHRFAQILDDEEILSALQFITLVFIFLPLTSTLPANILGLAWLGRGQLVDPYVILLVVVFVASISFASLLAMRQIGPQRGIEFSGLMGGLVNSEATTAGLAHRAKEAPGLIGAAVVGSLLASTTMLVRNLAIAAFAAPPLALAMAPYVGAVFLVGVLLAYRLRVRGDAPHDAVRVKNPFAILPALRFAAFFAAVSVLVRLATTYLGEAGVYVAALGGFVSAGAVVASLGSLVATGQIGLEIALRTSLLAMAASVAGKLVILRAVNLEAFAKAAPSYATMTAVAVLAAVATFLL